MIFKKTMGMIIGAAVALSGVSMQAAADAEGVSVSLNGKQVSFESELVIENDRILVPCRAILSLFDCAAVNSEYDGIATVQFQRGSDKITLSDGAEVINVNNREMSLDAAPRTAEGDFLVPLRAVSESFGCNVDWSDELSTAYISKKQGHFEIESERIEKTLTYSDGTPLAYISCVYPVIKHSDDANTFISEVNQSFKEKAMNYATKVEEGYSADAALIFEELGSECYRPMYFTLTYDVNENSKSLISFTLCDYQNTNGAHPNQVRESVTYDAISGRKLSLENVLDVSMAQTEAKVYDTFREYMEKNYEGFDAETEEMIAQEASNVNWYLTDEALVMYFNPYQIAPYAFGSPTVEISHNS